MQTLLQVLIYLNLTRKRLQNMLSGDKNAHFFGFKRDPFVIVEDITFPVGEIYED